jgi:hypothetical protein
MECYINKSILFLVLHVTAAERKIRMKNYEKEFQLAAAVAPIDGVNSAAALVTLLSLPLGSSTNSFALIW